MPFTLSHAAVTILFKPWLNQKISFTGLALGCMAPDFEYFLRMQMRGEIGHQFWGIFLLDLPVAMILAWVIHSIIRDPLIENLPLTLKQRLIIYHHHNWNEYFKQHVWIVALSIIIGIFTHIVWDAFTHKTGFFVQQTELLRIEIIFGDFRIYLYKLLQYMSSVLGLVLIFIYLYKMPSYTVENFKKRQSDSYVFYWSMVCALLITFWGVWCFMNPDLIFGAGHVIVSLIACAFWSFFFTALIFKSFKHAQFKL